MTYKLIQECGLEWANYSCMASGKVVRCVSADQLEAFLSKAVRVYGKSDIVDIFATSNNKNPFDTHSGLLIGYKEIPKLEPVTKEEVVEMIGELLARGITNVEVKDVEQFINRIEKAGIR